RVLRRGYFAPDDLVVQSSESAYCVLGKASPAWIGGGHAGGLAAREYEFASYVGVRGVVVPATRGADEAAECARLLCALLAREAGPPVLVRVQAAVDGAWQQWNRIRLLCDHSPRLQVLLELDPAGDAADMRQWQAEPVRVVVVAAQMFVANASGYPVLRRRQQQAVQRWMDFDVALAVQQPDSGGAVSDHIRYLRHLAAARPEHGPAGAAADEYRDVLQAPLQPLADHLASVTYETFELDAPKYEHYEEAMARAIADVAARRGSDGGPPIVLAVVGAGRGPLVSRADVDVVAVEKNPNALVELQRKNVALWGGAVTLVHADMRRWAPERRADILVSELLGSFGDNELSPECLDGALARAAAPGCVCIPRRYAAYMAPVSAPALFRRARELGDARGLETPYVVNMHAAAVLAAEKEAWSFCHAPAERHADPCNERVCAAAFAAQGASLVHGIAGFFDAELYPGVELSTRPQSHTEGMYSWFPIFFPLRLPLTVAAGDAVVVRMWRRVSDTRVWYEWCVDAAHATSGIHNAGGSGSWIGL
ncbi:hypothetical protein IWQ57_004677, partial [Coemansia nantahalensis]